MKKILIWLITLYQKTLSRDSGWFSIYHPGGYCKYRPNCSEYCKQAIKKKGVTRGILLGFWRLLRCNPWSAGGDDPVY